MAKLFAGCDGTCGKKSARECERCATQMLKNARFRSNATPYGLPVETRIEFVPLGVEARRMFVSSDEINAVETDEACFQPF